MNSHLFPRLATRSISHHCSSRLPAYTYQQHLLFSTTKRKKKLPKKWKPTTTMFMPSPDKPGTYVLSKTHNLKFEYDPTENKTVDPEHPEESSLDAQVEAVAAGEIDDEETRSLRFIKSYKYILATLMMMVVALMSGFTQGFTRLKWRELMSEHDDEDEHEHNDGNARQQRKAKHVQDDKNVFWNNLKVDESVSKMRQKAICEILYSLQHTATDCVLIDKESRYENKAEREARYLASLDSRETMDDPQTHENKLLSQVLSTQWPHVFDLSKLEIDDISDNHFNLSQYIQDVNLDNIQLKFVPPFDALRYGEAKKKKLMWMYSNRYLEWMQVVMTFNDPKQRMQDLNVVAIRMRFYEFHCYPRLNTDGTSDITQWLIEKRRYEPKAQHLRDLLCHRNYYWKKYWHRVEPEKYEYEFDDKLYEYYGRDIFAEEEEEKDGGGEPDENEKDETVPEQNEDIQQLFGKSGGTEDEPKIEDEELVKFVERLEARIERKKRLQEARTIQNGAAD